ncbi:MAG: ABC transporter permease [Acidimicrobiales bacterium]
MSDLSLALAHTRYALRGFLRDPSALGFTAFFPLLLLLLFNAIFKGMTDVDGTHVRAPAYYTASIIAYEITLVSFSSLVVRVTTTRERGLLKRFRGTPMPSWVYLFSEIARTLIVVAATVAVLVAVGAIFYDVSLSSHLLVGLVTYLVVGVFCFSALALALTGLCRTADAASAIGPLAATILAFLSGVFIPVAVMPAWMLNLGAVFPLEHVARGLQAAFLLRGATGVTGGDLVVPLAWGVAGLVVAVRLFRWEPLAASGRRASR